MGDYVAVIFGLLASESGMVEKDELIRTLKEFEPGLDFRDIVALFEHVSLALFAILNFVSL